MLSIDRCLAEGLWGETTPMQRLPLPGARHGGAPAAVTHKIAVPVVPSSCGGEWCC